MGSYTSEPPQLPLCLLASVPLICDRLSSSLLHHARQVRAELALVGFRIIFRHDVEAAQSIAGYPRLPRSQPDLPAEGYSIYVLHCALHFAPL